MKEGMRIKYSPEALQRDRDYYMCLSGRRKDQAKRWYDDKAARRGTIAKVRENGYAVKWDDGTVSITLFYLVIEA